ncbi:hypothetical protein ACYOEI_21065 [Singulisphaera rosea]
MQRVRFIRPLPWVIGLSIFCGPLLVGCGGSAPNEMITPKAPPGVSAKDSMDYFKSHMKKKGKGVRN